MNRPVRFALWGLAAGSLGAACVVLLASVLNPFFFDTAWLVLLPMLGVLISLKHPPARLIHAVSALLLGAAAALYPRGPASPHLFVLGVDGATFEVIDAHADVLPNFALLKAEGSRGVLHSVEPMFSPLLWTTIASGRTPDEHGVRGFHVHSDDCKVARFWDVAEEMGEPVGLYKWLVDYPPRSFKTGGFWVPSWLAPDVQTSPPELSVVKELELSKRLRRKQVAARQGPLGMVVSLVRVGVRLSTLGKAVAWSLEEKLTHPDLVTTNVEMQKLRGWIDRDVYVAQVYKTEPGVASFTYYATDGLAHLYWDRFASAGQGEVTPVLAAYMQADAILGDIRGIMGPDARLIVVSDHGFKPMDGTGLAGQFAPLTEGLRARMGTLLPAAGPYDVTKVGHKLTLGFADASMRDAVRTAVLSLTDASGEVFYKTEDIEGSAGTLGLTLADEQITAERLKTETVGGEPIANYVALTDAYSGTHKYNGVFYAYGKDVPAGQELPEVPLLDAGPTILAAAGLPAAKNMTGKAQIFTELPRVDSWDALVLDLQWMDVGEAQGVNDEALKALGYIDAGPASPK